MKKLNYFLKRKLNLYIKNNYNVPVCESENRIAYPRICRSEAFAGDSPMAIPSARDNLDNALSKLDESFSDSVLRLIDEKGMSDSQCYKKAGIDRKLFSKIRSNPQYKPSKSTAIALAIALELSLDECKSLISKAGYALSHSNKADVIIEFFILEKNYDIITINEALFEYDQPLL